MKSLLFILVINENRNGAFMATVKNLRVSTDELLKMSGQLRQAIGDMRKDFERIEKNISHTGPYWKGEAGLLHRKLYNERSSDIQSILKMLEKYPEDICRMANIYMESEVGSRNSVSKLKNNTTGSLGRGSIY